MSLPETWTKDDAVHSAKSMPANRIPRFVGHGAEVCRRVHQTMQFRYGKIEAKAARQSTINPLTQNLSRRGPSKLLTGSIKNAPHASVAALLITFSYFTLGCLSAPLRMHDVKDALSAS